MTAAIRRPDLIQESEIQTQCLEFLRLMKDALAAGSSEFPDSSWDKVREMPGNVSASRVQRGFSPSETATIVFSFRDSYSPSLQEMKAALSESSRVDGLSEKEGSRDEKRT